MGQWVKERRKDAARTKNQITNAIHWKCYCFCTITKYLYYTVGHTNNGENMYPTRKYGCIAGMRCKHPLVLFSQLATPKFLVGLGFGPEIKANNASKINWAKNRSIGEHLFSRVKVKVSIGWMQAGWDPVSFSWKEVKSALIGEDIWMCRHGWMIKFSQRFCKWNCVSARNIGHANNCAANSQF